MKNKIFSLNFLKTSLKQFSFKEKNNITYCKSLTKVDNHRTIDSLLIFRREFDFFNKEINEKKRKKEEYHLVKTAFCPINPLDIQKIYNLTELKKFPITLGTECSGIILQSSNNELIGKKISCIIPTGSYQEYHLLDNLLDSVLYSNNAVLEEISCMNVNPITCLGLISHIKKGSGLVNLTCNSSLGKMINRVCLKKGIKVVNILRKSKSITDLNKNENMENIISLDDENFNEKFLEKTEKFNVGYCFDPIGGEITGKILKILPKNSISLVYGSLSGEDIRKVNGFDLRMNNKSLIGFSLFNWWMNHENKDQIHYFIKNNSELFKTNIKKCYPIELYHDAIKDYMLNMSEGKVLIHF